jgi:hypothetical protein
LVGATVSLGGAVLTVRLPVARFAAPSRDT